MLRHLFRLMWNRKRTNLLLITEIVCSFVVLFGVATILLRLGTNYLQPYGFEHHRVWRLSITANQGQMMPRPQLDEALRQVAALPGVEAVSLTSDNTPFSFSNSNSHFHRGQREQVADIYDAGDDYGRALGMHLREGRWFGATNEGTSRRPVVINQQLRDLLFAPGEQAIGQRINVGTDAPDELLVTGVADDTRFGSDFSAATPSAWLRLIPHDTTSWQTAAVMVRVRPGTGAELEQQIVKTIARATPNWLGQIRSLEEARSAKFKAFLAPVLGLAMVCLFLIINVALGLFGILWYNINQRRSEIGLRRAVGATGGRISGQFLTETLILTFFGVVIGTVLAAQFPLLGAFEVPALDYVRAIGLSAVLIFALAALCAVQPSRLAARIRPAIALREE